MKQTACLCDVLISNYNSFYTELFTRAELVLSPLNTTSYILREKMHYQMILLSLHGLKILCNINFIRIFKLFLIFCNSFIRLIKMFSLNVSNILKLHLLIHISQTHFQIFTLYKIFLSEKS